MLIRTLRQRVALKFPKLLHRPLSSPSPCTAMAAAEPKVIILAGATSAGKSAVAMELVKRMDAEIVIADAVQIYRGLDIGSNKPTKEEQAAAPHHLVDLYDTAYTATAHDFASKASEAILDILSRGKVPVVVGGCTMWIQWLVSGIPDAPPSSAAAVAAVEELLGPLEREGRWEEALAVLNQRDASLAAKVTTNNWYRLKRYLTLHLDLQQKAAESGQEIAAHQGTRTPVLPGIDMRCFFLMEDRMHLYHTIDFRCMQMLQRGLIEEVGELLLSGALRPEMPVHRAIGYRQTIEYLCQQELAPKDSKAFDLFISEFGKATRNYARKQHNWYRKDPSFLFLKMERPHTNQPTRSKNNNKLWYEHEIDSNPTEEDLKQPYEHAADEVMHWLAEPREAYLQPLQTQVHAGKCFNKFSKALPAKDYVPEDPIEAEILRYLRDEKQAEKDRKEFEKLYKRPQAPVPVKKTPSGEWTANCLDARLGPITSKIKFFNSTLDRMGNVESMIAQADAYRQRLWAEAPELMAAFKEQKAAKSNPEEEDEC